jgi:hypothetical protein
MIWEVTGKYQKVIVSNIVGLLGKRCLGYTQQSTSENFDFSSKLCGESPLSSFCRVHTVHEYWMPQYWVRPPDALGVRESPVLLSFVPLAATARDMIKRR